jgi:hypothetical protein
MSQAGRLGAGGGGGGGGVESITGNSGGAVSPDIGSNINIDALYTNTVVGTPGTNTLTITPTTGGYPTTPYVVGPAGQAGYTTIQSAINAANTAGGGVVVLQPGTYTENLTLYSDVHIMGLNFADAGGGAEIIGVHTPPTTGGFVFRNVRLQSATHIFSSIAAGSAHLVIADACIFVTNGYTFNLPNWTGQFELFDTNDLGSTNDGFINNTGGASVALYSGAYGNGTGNTMTISGFIFTDAAEFFAPVNFTTGANLSLIRCSFSQNVTCSGNATGFFSSCDFETGVNTALTTTSVGNISLYDVSIDSSAANVITGTGTIEFGSVTYLTNTGIAGTITKNYTTRFETGVLKLSDATDGILKATAGLVSATALTDGQILIGSTGNDPVAATLTAGTGIGITNAAGSITISAAAGSVVQVKQANITGVIPVTTGWAFDASIPQISEGITLTTLTITPTSATNILLFKAFAWGQVANGANTSLALFQGVVTDALAASMANYCVGPGYTSPATLFYSMVSGTTSPITFTLEAGTVASIWYINGDNSGGAILGTSGMSYFEIMEIQT